MNNIKCENCYNDFTSYDKKARFCSRSCYIEFNKAPIPHPCTENLEITNFSHKSKSGEGYWNVKCNFCGETKTMRSSSIKIAKSCGCLNKNRGPLHVNWEGIGDLSGSFLAGIKKHAKRRNSISKEYLWELYVKQNGKCAISKLDISFGIFVTVKGRSRIKDCTASLDRIDSNLGYIDSNVQWLHKDVNFMKQQFQQQYFIDMCKLISDNNK